MAASAAHEACRIAGEERLAQFGLPCEVVVERGLGDVKLGCDVGIAEGVESAALDKPLGDIEYLRGSVAIA